MPGSVGSLRITSTTFLSWCFSRLLIVVYRIKSVLAKSELHNPRCLDGPRKYDDSFVITRFLREIGGWHHYA